MTYSEISKIIYVYDTSNPPLPDQTTNVEIIIKNGVNLNLVNWARASHISQYTLKISEPKSFGLTNASQNNIESFFDDIILSCNLLMRYGAIIIYSANINKFQTEFVKEKPEPVKVEKTGSHIKISVNETIVTTDSYMLGCSFKEEIDENEVKKILNIIQNVNLVKSNLKLNDLKKSLSMYRTAVSSFNRLTIFRNFFSTMDLACNCDGEDRNSLIPNI